MLEFLKIQYRYRRITAEKLRSYVPKIITVEQFEQIIGRAYEDSTADAME